MRRIEYQPARSTALPRLREAAVVIYDDEWPEHDDEIRVTATEARGRLPLPESPLVSDDENARRRAEAREREDLVLEARRILGHPAHRAARAGARGFPCP